MLPARTVTAIELRAVPHASGLTDTCIEITLDGEDTWIDLNASMTGVDFAAEHL